MQLSKLNLNNHLAIIIITDKTNVYTIFSNIIMYFNELIINIEYISGYYQNTDSILCMLT